MRDWVTNVRTTHYILGTAYGAHPYPVMVRNFQRVIGDEARRQILEKEERLPDLLIACVGGGSNAIGLFYPFLEDDSREDGRRGSRRRRNQAGETRRAISGRLARRAAGDAVVIFCRTSTARFNSPTASAPDWITPRSAPSTPGCATSSRVEYTYATDDQALDGVHETGAAGRHHSRARKRPRRRRSHRARARRWARTSSSSSTSPAAATRTWRRWRRR